MRALVSLAIASLLASAAAASDAASKKPEAPPASVMLSLDAAAPDVPWKLKIENTGSVPLRITADARLASFDIVPPDAGAIDPRTKKPIVAKAVHCALPASMRPTNDVDRALVVAPKRSYSEMIDPKLYCFGDVDAKALVPGAKVTARMAFPERRGANGQEPPPYIASGFDGVTPEVSPVKAVVAIPVTLGANAPPSPTPSASASSSSPPADAFPPKLTLRAPAFARTSDPSSLSVTVTVHNDGARKVTLLYKPESLGFEVLGPNGLVRCTFPQLVGGTVPEAYSHLAPKASESLTVLVATYCAPGTFDQEGLYSVRPRLDTRGSSADALGIDAFEGEVVAPKAILVRVEGGASGARKSAGARERPQVDPQ